METEFPSSEVTAWFNQRMAQALGKISGEARQRFWTAEDGWLVGYSTTKVEGGPHDGYYVTLVYKPVGKGAKGGRKAASQWERVKTERSKLRREAKARALYWYGEHSPRWKARNQSWITRELAR